MFVGGDGSASDCKLDSPLLVKRASVNGSCSVTHGNQLVALLA